MADEISLAAEELDFERDFFCFFNGRISGSEGIIKAIFRVIGEDRGSIRGV